MKKLIVFVSLLYLTVCQVESNQMCIIQLDINGLHVGDSIFLSTTQKPINEIISIDTFWVTALNNSSFCKQLAHTECISIRYQPLRADSKSTTFGTFLVKPGDNLRLQGTLTDLSTISVNGGFYNDSLVARLVHMERLEKTSQSDEAKALRTFIMKEINDSEYAIYLFLDNMQHINYEELCARFEKLEPLIKTSQMGQCLKNTIETWELLQPGVMAPEFTVRDIFENEINLSDYKGKFLLVYCWDICPTTFQIQKQVTDLYHRFGKGKFAILAFTSEDTQNAVSKISIAGLDDTHPIIVNYRQQILDQLSQPWSLVYTKNPVNRFMIRKYYICNATMLTFISPEGRIIARSHLTGLDEVIQTVTRILQQER